MTATMEKNNNKVCKICDKCFSSGKAMGGHMRSHFVKLPIPPKPETKNQAPDNSRNSNTENEAIPYPQNPTRKTSKCHGKFIAEAEVKANSEQMASVDSLTAEEAAWSLIMLSNDKWPEGIHIKNLEMKEMRAKDKDGKDNSLVQTQAQIMFKCDRCEKTFQSHQALGGHKANHKKNGNAWQGGDFGDDGKGKKSDDVDEKMFECSYCCKVFKSARALGGHKKVHFTKTNGGRRLVVDLNFPAPMEN